MKICFTGDSISHGTDSGIRAPRSIGEFIAYQIKETQCRNICFPSDGIDEQTIRWNQISASEKLEFDYVISMNGNNDSLEVMVSDYPTFFAMIRAEIKPTCKIILCTLTPAQDVYPLQTQLRIDRNNYIAIGEAMAPYRDALVTEHTSYLDDGAGSLKAMYWASTSDHLHINTQGREVIADCVINKMRELNWI